MPLTGKRCQVASSAPVIWPTGISEYRTSQFQDGLLKGHSPMASPSSAMRREAVPAVGGFHPAFRLSQDFDPGWGLADHHDLANLPDVLPRGAAGL